MSWNIKIYNSTIYLLDNFIDLRLELLYSIFKTWFISWTCFYKINFILNYCEIRIFFLKVELDIK